MRNPKKHLLTKNTTHKQRRLKTKGNHYSFALVLCFGIFSHIAWAQDDSQDWWFNVELMIFKRDLLPTNTEDFNQSTIEQVTETSNNLLLLQALKNQEPLYRYLQQLPECQALETPLLPIPFNIQSLSVHKGVDLISKKSPLIVTSNTKQNLKSDKIANQQQNVDSLINSLDNNNANSQNPSMFNENRTKVNNFINNSMRYSVLTLDTVESTEYKQILSNLFESITKPSGIPLLTWLETLQKLPIEDISQHNASSEENAVTSFSQRAEIAKNQEQNKIVQDKLYDLIVYLQKVIESTNDVDVDALSISCNQSELLVSYPSKIGVNLFSHESAFINHRHMLNKQDLALEEFSEKVFNQRDISPLLYTAWRENVVFGIDNADYIRIVAGDFLSVDNSQNQITYEDWLAQYNQQQEQVIALQAISSENVDLEAQREFFQELELALENNESINWLTIENNVDNQRIKADTQPSTYEIDGVLKIYLEYVNQVPYLHIDSKMNHYKKEVDSESNPQIKAYPFKQRRRIISKQIHYFDHPAFGMIVRLERFIPPTPAEEEVE